MLSALIRVGFASAFRNGFGGSGKKRTASQKMLMVLLVAFIAVSLLFSMGMTFFSLAPMLISAGLDILYFGLTAVAAFAASVMGTLFTAAKQLFESKDNELLLAMPIPPRHILFSRIFVLLVMEYLFTLLIMLPASVAYFAVKPPTANSIICIVGCFLLLPLLAITVVSLFGWLVSYISSKVRNKNLMTYVMTAVFMILYFYFYNMMMGGFMELVEKGESLQQSLQTALPPFYSFGAAAADGSFAQLGLLALWCILPFAAVCALLSANFIKISTANRGMKKKAYVRRELKAGSLMGAALRKELSTFFSIPIYVMNCGLGSIFLLIGTVLVAIKGPSLLQEMFEGSPMLTNTDMVLGLAALMIGFCTLMDCSAGCSISVEGKNLWVVKSLPIPTQMLLGSKILTNVIIAMPAALIAAVVCCIVMNTSPLGWAALLSLAIAYPVFTAFFGLFANLKFPKFNWTNVAVVVKQSASMMVAIFGGMAVLGIGVLLYMTLASGMPIALFLLACSGAMLLLSALMAAYIFTRGKKLFERM